MKKRYQISLHGCDDCTAFAMELTEEEAALLVRVGELSEHTSQCGCQPTLRIDEDDDEDAR